MGEDCRTGGKGGGNRFFPLFLFILVVVVAVVVFVIIFGSRTWHNERKGRKRKTYERKCVNKRKAASTAMKPRRAQTTFDVVAQRTHIIGTQTHAVVLH